MGPAGTPGDGAGRVTRRAWIGVDVGAERKGFDLAIVDRGELLALHARLTCAEAVELIVPARPRVVGIDSPRSAAPVGARARDSERLLARTVCGIRWTPDAATLRENAYYAWVRAGLALFRALTERGIVTIEVFPTAAWTRWLGPRRFPESRADWSRRGLAALGLAGVPRRTNQDARDAIAAAVTARLFDEGRAEAIGGEIVVPGATTAPPTGGDEVRPPGVRTFARSPGAASQDERTA
jgi:predicted nuclease with RNAse H fold